MRDDKFDAANYFAPKDASGKRIKGKLDFRDFGGAIGGPIQKGKLFFFGGSEYKRLDRVDGPFRRTMPTRAELNGDFSARTAAIIDPLTGQPFPGNVIPAARITADGRAIANAHAEMLCPAGRSVSGTMNTHAAPATAAATAGRRLSPRPARAQTVSTAPSGITPAKK